MSERPGPRASRRRRRRRTARPDVASELARLVATIRRAGPAPPRRRPTSFRTLVGLLRSDYAMRGLRSWDRAERAIRHLRPAFAPLAAHAIAFRHLRAYVARRVRQGARPGTIHAEMAALRRMLALAHAGERIAALPVFPSLPASPAREGFLTPEQVEAVVANLRPPVAELVHALWITGWRRREVQFLRWEDVHLEAGEIRLTAARSKTRDARVFPFAASPSLAAIVRARHAARAPGSVYLFERSPGRPVRDFRAAWQRACERAGVPGRVPHDLRRSRARALTRARVPQSVAMRLLGHKTANMFLRYDVAATEDLVEAVAAAEAWAKAKKQES